jgi:hypothetical protein
MPSPYTRPSWGHNHSKIWEHGIAAMYNCMYIKEIKLMNYKKKVGQGLLTIETSRWHSDTPYLWDSSGRVISPPQRTLPDNTRHTRQTSTPPSGFETAIPSSDRPQITALDRAATHLGLYKHRPIFVKIIIFCFLFRLCKILCLALQTNTFNLIFIFIHFT